MIAFGLECSRIARLTCKEKKENQHKYEKGESGKYLLLRNIWLAISRENN